MSQYPARDETAREMDMHYTHVGKGVVRWWETGSSTFTYTCSNGHRWETADDSVTVCPSCGDDDEPSEPPDEDPDRVDGQARGRTLYVVPHWRQMPPKPTWQSPEAEARAKRGYGERW